MSRVAWHTDYTPTTAVKASALEILLTDLNNKLERLIQLLENAELRDGMRPRP